MVQVDAGVGGAGGEEEFLRLPRREGGGRGEGEGAEGGGGGGEEEGVGEGCGGVGGGEGGGDAVEDAVVGAGDDLDGEVSDFGGLGGRF